MTIDSTDSTPMTGPMTAPTTGPTTTVDDVAAVDVVVVGLLLEFFGAVSFPAGGRPAYTRALDLFRPEGRLVKGSTEPPESLGVREFVDDRQRLYDAGELTWFEEAELSGRTDVFGRIAHRYSRYVKRGCLSGAEFAVEGVISTQFVNGPSGWRIVSMIWDDER
jgi:ribosomal-protein-serine acetyltransferase